VRENERGREGSLVASNLLASAVTTDIDAAASSLGLEDSLDVHSDLDVETSDGIDLSAVVGGGLVDSGLDVDGEAPSSIDLLDGSADVDKELAVALIAALAGPSELPEELNSGHAIDVLEGPAEGSPLGILEALEIHPVNTLGNSTSPVVLVVDNGLAFLDNLPDGLADGDDLVDVNLVLARSDIARSVNTRDNLDLSGSLGVDDLDSERLVLLSESENSNKKSDKKSAHFK